MKTFQEVVRTLIKGLEDGSIRVGNYFDLKRRPEPPPAPDPDKVVRSIMNSIKGTPQPGDYKVEFQNPLAKEALQSVDRGEEPANSFSYIKAMPAKRGIHFQWGRTGVGFGECDLYFEDGRWKANTEHMGPEFLHDLLVQFSRTVVIDE